MMKYLFLLLAFLLSCRDQYAPQFDQMDAAQIEGLWKQETSPFWYWHFSDGRLHKAIFAFSVNNLVEHYYGYSTRRDTVFLRDMLHDTTLIYTAYFDTDSTATLTDVGGAIHIQYRLKRF